MAPRPFAPLPGGLGIGRIESRDDLRHAELGRIGSSIADELGAEGGRFWLHLDVDVLDGVAFPATDYLVPDGLSITELKAILAPLAGSPALAGVNVTRFNPEKDRDGSCATVLTDMLKSVLIT